MARGGAGNDYDVAIVGYGPVGQMLAALLGRAGWRVGVFERHREIYPLPRAVHLDHEIMRLLQSLGLADALVPQMVPVRDYQWFGADGDLLLRFDTSGFAPSGWDYDYMFFQPELEQAIDARVRSEPTVEVARGWSAEGFIDAGEGVVLRLRGAEEPGGGELEPAHAGVREVSASWLIGADGANSLVRETCAIARRDLGFQERWLVVDAEPHDMDALSGLPVACQWCDPRRPTTHIQSGPRHRRWEFMLLPGEEPSELEQPERVWSLLAPWYARGDGPLVRSTVYEFRSVVAEQMRSGRVLIAGDSAHLTPPFLGQGMCSGMRDAANVAWKLDLVLRGLVPERLLDTVAAERQPQNEAVIALAVELGKVLCQLDPQAAAERDAALRQAGPPPPLGLPPIEGGLLHRPAGRTDSLAGTLSVQGVVARGGREGRFDDVVGGGFRLISVAGDPSAPLASGQRAHLHAIGSTIVSLDPDAPGGVRDLDGGLTRWLADAGAYAVLVRPDLYVFGSVAAPEQLPELVDDLTGQLELTSTPTTSGAIA